MNRVRMVAIVAAALGVAVGAGALFQPQESPQQPAPVGASMAAQTSLVGLAPGVADEAPLPAPISIEQTALTDDAGPDETPVMALAGAGVGEPGLAPRALDDAAPASLRLAAPPPAVGTTEPVVGMPDDPVAVDGLLAEIEACARWLVATPEAGAMLDLSLFAPCDAGETVRLDHAGVQFEAVIDADGQLLLSLPALAGMAEVSVIFADGARVSDAAAVPDLGLFDRVVLHWQGPAVLALNAYEFEAEFGASGHIHPASAGMPAQAGHGALSMLGGVGAAGEDGAAVAALVQIYSYPMGLSARLGQVDLELEVAISEASCGRDIDIALMPVLDAAPGDWHRISITLPECDGQGGFLVLKNLLPALTIASN
ncbi:MAG: hypothetical protein ACK4LQ_07190 [Pararhodobacter sp.]